LDVFNETNLFAYARDFRCGSIRVGSSVRRAMSIFSADSYRIAALRQRPVSELVNSSRAADDDPTMIDRISL
jgi:hypothetical protein